MGEGVKRYACTECERDVEPIEDERGLRCPDCGWYRLIDATYKARPTDEEKEGSGGG